MTTFRQALARLAAFFRKAPLDHELNEELAAHIEFATQDHIRQGMTTAEARRMALAKLGGVEPSREAHRDARGLAWLDGLIQDMRYATRGLRRSPGFTVTAVITLATGIGVNAAVFSVTDAFLFKGFPLVQHNDRLVYMSTFEGCCVSYPDFLDWREQGISFDGMVIVGGTSARLTDETGLLARYDATEVSAGTFPLVGQRPVMGRDFTEADEQDGAPPVAILQYDFWESRFAKDPAILGRVVRINDAPTTIIGVMPQGFGFPQRQSLWMPMVRKPAVMSRLNRGTWCVIARMAPGATVESARAEMNAIAQRLASIHPEDKVDGPVHVENYAEFMLGPNSTKIYGAMWGAVGFVLLIACANLANLMLARATGRTREISLRVALGAGRWRIVRQLMIEALMLSALGGVLGWWVAKASLAAYQYEAGHSAFMRWMVTSIGMDYRVLGYLVAISIVTGMLFGLAPARQLAKLDVNASMKDGARGATGGVGGKRLSALLVMLEMALAVVLLAGAGVMVRSFLKLYTAELGVQTASILTAAPDIPSSKRYTAAEWIELYDQIQARVGAIPGVESVAIASTVPADATRNIPYELAGAEQPDEARRSRVGRIVIAPGYFHALGAAVIAGRDFGDADAPSAEPVAIVNRRFADKHWPSESALGKRIRIYEPQTPVAAAQAVWRTVVGVASNIAQNDIARPELNALVYVPYRQRTVGRVTILVRSRIPPASLVSPIRKAIESIDPDLTVWGLDTLSNQVRTLYWKNEFYGSLFLVFAVIALLLASLGLYAVIAHSVSQRTQEIGVRMALGGTMRDIRALILRNGLLPMSIGLGVGLAASLAVNRLLRSQLAGGVSAYDPLTLLVVSAVLIIAGVLGCLIPARRAMRVSPVVALRHD